MPKPLLPFAHRCFGLTSQPDRLSQIRQERRPGSDYASLAQRTFELRNAEDMYHTNGVPFVNSASMSVEEISATELQKVKLYY